MFSEPSELEAATGNTVADNRENIKMRIAAKQAIFINLYTLTNSLLLQKDYVRGSDIDTGLWKGSTKGHLAIDFLLF